MMEDNLEFGKDSSMDTTTGSEMNPHGIDQDKELYFTPDISDIRVGYECEWRLKELDWIKYHDKSVYNWQKHIITQNDFHGGELGDDFHSFGNSACEFRVPYLTKEQIEAEGWTEEGNYKGTAFRKDNLVLNYSYKSKILRIIVRDPSAWSGNYPNYSGECKDINTFRYICKLLNI